MIAKVSQTLNQIQWSNQAVADFLGRYLSEPKPDVLFEPNKKITVAQLQKKILQLGLMLDLKSQMLFTDEVFYLNGEPFTATPSQAMLLRQLADTRKVDSASLAGVDENLLNQLHQWYLSGYIQIGNDV